MSGKIPEEILKELSERDVGRILTRILVWIPERTLAITFLWKFRLVFVMDCERTQE